MYIQLHPKWKFGMVAKLYKITHTLITYIIIKIDNHKILCQTEQKEMKQSIPKLTIIPN